MLKNNLKLAFRNITRNKLHTVINIAGLSTASAFCILVFLHVKNENSFDKFHHDQDQLFRVEVSELDQQLSDKTDNNFFSFLMKDAEQKNEVVTPPVLAIDLKRNFPEIENAIRFDHLYKPVIKVGNQSFLENDNITYADADFFKVFNYPLIKGDAASVLGGFNQVVISERLAKKYFGDKDPVGKTLTITSEDKPLLLTINAIAKDFPANSSFQFDMILPLESKPDYQERIKNGINTFNEPLILKLKKGVNQIAFKQKLDAFAKLYFKTIVESDRASNPSAKIDQIHLFLRPFANAHYNQSYWYHYTDLKNIYYLTCLAAIILIIACFNYILLTLTNAVSRSQDVGVRKTIGAERKQIILQYYTETQLLACISVISGLLLAVTIMPVFNAVTGANLQMSYFSFGDLAVSLTVLAFLLGLLAGIYPAFAMSGLKPLNIMRGFSAYRISPVLSKSLVVVQFTICIILVISSLVINKQMKFISQTEMGFDKDQVLVIRDPYNYTEKQSSAQLKETLYHFTDTEPYIQDVTGTSFKFGGFNSNAHDINGSKMMITALNVDFNYFAFNKIAIVKGRAFSSSIASDSARLTLTDAQSTGMYTKARHNVVVNETLYNLLGKPPIDAFNMGLGGVIIGVCKDYHNEDLTKAIQPTYHTVNRAPISFYWIKIKAGQSISQVMDKIKANWNKLTNKQPFDYTFMDEDVAKSYDAYLRWMTTITTSCILAIIIACLGLFGLSALSTINRTKEIGIRKVLGASLSNLFVLLNRGTLILAFCSFIIAVPIAWYVTNKWLQNFAYRIKPDLSLICAAGLIALITALIAVSYHTIKAAIANPVKSLRSE
ncbi:MAG: FtsX-like permease family protein [Mucilaginibacter sp.]|nr:FtsX-like permease family protein [Mucilaginibacter sp.]